MENFDLFELNGTYLRAKIYAMQSVVSSKEISLRWFENDDRRTRFFTGLSTYALLRSLYDKLEADLPISLKLTTLTTLVFYITLVRMRLDLSFSFLAYQFKVHHSTISICISTHVCLCSTHDSDR